MLASEALNIVDVDKEVDHPLSYGCVTSEDIANKAMRLIEVAVDLVRFRQVLRQFLSLITSLNLQR